MTPPRRHHQFSSASSSDGFYWHDANLGFDPAAFWLDVVSSVSAASRAVRYVRIRAYTEGQHAVNIKSACAGLPPAVRPGNLFLKPLVATRGVDPILTGAMWMLRTELRVGWRQMEPRHYRPRAASAWLCKQLLQARRVQRLQVCLL